MKRAALYLSLLLLFASCSAPRYARGPESSVIESRRGQLGKIEAVTYRSSEPRLEERRMVVYLPESYGRDTLRRYPVLYLLHGARGNETTWADSADVFRRVDSLRREGKAEDFIIVLPNMNHYFGERDYNGGHAQNAVRAFWLLTGEAERYFIHDVVMRVDSMYRTIPEKSGRAVAGLSAGALQSLYLSAGNPETFDYIGLFSPYVYPTFAAAGHGDVYGGLWPRLERQFADPPALFAIYIGKADFFYPHVAQFDRKMDRKGYPHEMIVSDGGHRWSNWRVFLTDFLQKVFR